MGVPLPRVLGALSDSAKLKFSNINSQLAELIFLPVITEDFANLTAWTEVDADGKVNLSGGVVSMDGGNSVDAHGIWYTAGIARAEGYLEIKSNVATALSNAPLAFSNTAALLWNTNGVKVFLCGSNVACLYVYADGYGLVSPVVATYDSVYYTLRIYIKKLPNGTTWGSVKFTIQGGTQFPTETVLSETAKVWAEVGATFYPEIQRYGSAAGNLQTVKEFRWYSGYATDAPYVEYVHDAGAGLAFDNLDLTAFAMPGTVPTTNLTFAYSFDDGVASYSAALTLANLQAVGKLTARHRYIRMRVYANSDGATLVYVDKPNSDTATDGIGVDVDAAIAAYQAANNSAPSNGEDSLVVGDSCKVAGVTYNGNVSFSSQSISPSSDSSTSFSPSSCSDSSCSDSSRSVASQSNSSDSFSIVVTTGTDSIQAQITKNIKACLKGITVANGYNYDIAMVEESRKLLDISNRWPFILLLENEPEKDDEGLVIRELSYVVWFFSKQDDRVISDPADASKDIDTEIAYYNRNAIADITKALNADIYRGYVDGTANARAEITEVLPGTHDLYVDETMVMFGTWCAIRVVTNIDATNPYQLRQGV